MERLRLSGPHASVAFNQYRRMLHWRTRVHACGNSRPPSTFVRAYVSSSISGNICTINYTGTTTTNGTTANYSTTFDIYSVGGPPLEMAEAPVLAAEPPPPLVDPTPGPGPTSKPTGKSCPRPAPGMEAGDPIIPATGEEVLAEPDYVGTGPSVLTFTRHFRSGWAVASAQRSLVVNPGLSRPWSHNHAVSLQRAGTSGVTGSTAAVVMGDGSTRTFSWVASTSSWVVANNPDTLTANATGLLYKRASDNSSWQFDAAGRLLTVTQRKGWTTSYTYSTASTPSGIAPVPGLLISVTNQFGRALNFTYNASSQLATVATPDAQTISFTYNSTAPATSRLTTVTYPGSTSGAVSKTYLYENATFPQLVTGITDEAGNRYASIAYDSQGRATSSQLAGGADLYSVNYAGLSPTVTDPLGTTRTFGYSTAQNTLAVTAANVPTPGPGGSAASRVQDANGFVTQETDFLGVNTMYTWDASRRLPLTTTRAAALPEAQTTSTTWHTTFTLPTLVTEAGRTTGYTYDSLGNTLTTTVTDTASSVARTTTWTYIASGNGQGQPGTQTAPNTGLTQFGYDAAGNLTSVTNPLGHVTTLAYDSAGRMTTRTEPTGLVTTYTYDNRSRLLTQTTGGLVTTFTYRATGQVATATLPSGYAITYSYDNAQRLTGWADNRGAQGVYTLDAMGNRTVSQIKTTGGTVVWQLAQSINNLNLPGSSTAGTGGATQTQSYGYNANADLTSQTNGLSQSTGYGLDGLKRITSVTDALSATASLAYNGLDAVTSATDFKGVTTGYTRDALGNATQETGNDAGTHSAQYDSLGLPSQMTDALSQTTSITRDLLGRPTLLTFTGGRTTTLSYDLTGSTYNASGAPNASKGYLSKIEDSSGTTTYQRDIFGRITVKTQTLVQTAPNNTSQQVGYSYNSQGFVDTITYPSGNALVHSYSAAGQLTGLSWNGTPIISSLTWTAAGQPAGWTWPFASSGGTNITATRSYDTAGRVTATEQTGYGYDAAGRLITLSQSLYSPSDSNPANSGITLGTTNWTAGYDATGRITSFNDTTSGGSGATSGFTYDANGNRATSSQSPGPAAGITSRSRTYSITTNTNRLASYSQTDVVSGSPVNTTTTFSINANGDTTGDGTKTYGFDVENRLASTSTGTSPTVSTSRYSHNALGQRTFKTLPITTIPTTADPGYAFTYYEDGTLIGEYGAAGTPSAGTAEYIWLPSPNGPVPVAAVINGAIFAIQADHLNTPRRLSNTSAQAVWQWKYSAFGDEQPTLAANRFADLAVNPTPGSTTIPPVTFHLRYPGQYADSESGLNYNYFRSYSSDTGRYTQPDPIGLDGGWNRFSYVGGDPLRFSDPKGLVAPAIAACMASPPCVAAAVAAAVATAKACVDTYNAVRNWMDSRAKNPPDIGPPNDWIQGPRRGRQYGPDGRPQYDIDKPHQGNEIDHVHEWPGGEREEPGRPVSPIPKAKN